MLGTVAGIFMYSQYSCHSCSEVSPSPLAKSLASTKASNRPAPRKSHQLIQYLENLASGSRGAPGLSLPRSWSCCHLRGQLRSRPLAYSLSRVHVW